MTSYRVGEVDLNLRILKIGFRRGALTSIWTALQHWWDLLTLERKERANLKAFLSAGWEFRPRKDLDWRALRDYYNSQSCEYGLLAQYPGGGLVILRNRLVLHLRPSIEQDSIEKDYLSRYTRHWKLDFGENLFEVELKFPEYDLEEAIQQELEFLRSSNDVICVEPSLIYHVQPPGSVRRRFLNFYWSLGFDQALDPYPQWHWDKIALSDAWKNGGTLGKGTYVAVIDLGFHKDLEVCPHVDWSAVLDEEGEILPCRPLPATPHGTFCAGLIGAIKDGEYVNGAAPECKLILVAVPEQGVMSQVALAKALTLCVKGLPDKRRGADVISCSLGLSENNNWVLGCALRKAIDFAHSNGRASGNRRLGAPVVWAVFNADEPILPCSVEGYAPLISVSQSTRADNRIDSGYGPALDLLAPGYKVNGISWDGGVWGIGKGEGSSLAAPCVAGVAALVLAANQNLTWEQVANVLFVACDPEVQCKVRINDSVGWGRLNAKRAVELARALSHECQ